MILSGIGGLTDAEKQSARMTGVVVEPFELEGRKLGVSVSVGIAILPDDGVGKDTETRKLFPSGDWSLLGTSGIVSAMFRRALDSYTVARLRQWLRNKYKQVRHGAPAIGSVIFFYLFRAP